MTEEKKFEKRRTKEGHFVEQVDKGIKLKKNLQKKQQKLLQTRHDYVFLQYFPVIVRWAIRNTTLSRSDLYMLLYLYPISIFNPTQFKAMMKDIGATDWYMWDRMKGDGWFIKYSKSGLKQYYKFSTKALVLVRRMHNMCMMEEKIPISKQRNVIAASKDKKDQEMMELIRQFNQKVIEKSEQSDYL